MFRSNELGQYVPAKSVSVKPESQRDYKPEDQFKFHLPQSLAYMDTNDSYLSFDVEVSGPGYVRPDWEAGAHSLIRRFRIMDGTGSQTLEEIEGYNALVSTKNTYNSNPSIHKNRGLFEGRSANNDVDNQLYYAGPQYTFTNADKNGNTPTSLKTKICLPIQSGVLNSGKVFPLLATKGLRVEVDLENANTAFSCPKALSLNGTDSAAYRWKLQVPILGATGADATAKQEKAAIDTEFSCTIKEPSAGGALNGMYKQYARGGEAPFPLQVGDILHIKLADGTSSKILGVVSGLGTDYGSTDFMQIYYIPDRAISAGLAVDYPADSLVFWSWADRELIAAGTPAYTPANIPTENSASQAMKDATKMVASYTISNVEYVVSQVSPPAAYNARLLSQINSSAGLSMDFNSYTLYRNNVFNANGVSQMLIPAREQRAYSALSLPLSQSNMGAYASMNERSFFGIVDGAANYNYIIGGKSVPDRRVNLARLSLSPAKPEALHLIEVEKGVSNCGVPVRDLRNKGSFLIARAFSKYGQIFNTAQQDLQLRVDYTASTKAKMFMNYICHLRRLNVSASGVNVVV